MSYQTYITEALVCGTFDRNTADRSYLLFTREAGMLYAEARSVREERSRQRFALQDFSLVRVSLIKGKVTWKIGSIEAQTNYFATADSKASRGSVVSTFKFLRRFLSGQEAMPTFFDYVTKALPMLASEITARDWLEKALQVRLLLELGYVDVRTVTPNIQLGEFTELETRSNPESLRTMEIIIAKAIATSHL